MYYVHTDRLGSYHVITDANGSVVERLSYDAWGNRRADSNWNHYEAAGTKHFFTRGYTGHEHLDAFHIINMNGRLYDPIVARFFSPDPYVYSSTSTQAYNRYSYALNNPLMYTDPDGEWVHLVVGAVIGGTLNWAMNGAEFSWKGLGYFGIGALSGALGAGIGAGVNSMFIAGGSFVGGFLGTSTVGMTTGAIAGALSGAAGGATSGLITGFGNALIGGQNIGQAAKAGLIGGGIGLAAGGILGGLTGGIDAVLNKRTFWTGSSYDDKVLAQASNLTHSQQALGSTDCATKSGEMIDRALGGSRSSDELWLAIKDNPNIVEQSTGLVKDRNFWEYFVDGRYSIDYPKDPLSITNAIQHLNDGYMLPMSIAGTPNHGVVLHSVTQRTLVNQLGKTTVQQPIMRIMDPYYGLVKNYSRILNYFLIR